MRKVLRFLGNVLVAIIQGKLMMRLRVDRYFLHIIYTCFLLWVMIFTSIQVEKTMVKVEKNNARLSELKIAKAQLTVKLSGFYRISTLEEMLQTQGSEVGFPTKPARRIGSKDSK